MDADATHVLDTKGQCCPMPVLETRKRLDDVAEGEILEILATDPGAESDIKALANRLNIEFLGIEEDGDVLKIYLKK